MVGLLQGKVVVITGSSSGIGRLIAFTCASQGADLVLHHLGTTQTQTDVQTLQEEINELGNGSKAVAIGEDLLSDGAAHKIVSKAVESFGEINVLVNNAGICVFQSYDKVSMALLETHLAVNFKALYALTQATSEQMKAQGKGGSIVSIASLAATLGARNLSQRSK
ncbi:uncharacterized protein PV07_04114 [Cladophialophora immunda]|uniref:Uncharacterized protein n=1 Tax=Cladophialophora immunda TaxID=569365 RepID=A0A0D2DA70_9EURO|nr:uncharacterized protein PV07_04114 [Cladophialophora immunda]KIW32584.1 hypothetical protein PV07_04114 [Cladophialophora immunda]